MDNLVKFNAKVRGNFKSALVVDSNLPMRRVTSDMLLKLGVRKVFQAVNGQAALTHIEREEIDIILCDFNLSKLSGIELLNIVRERETQTNKYVPFIVLSSNVSYDDVTTAIKLGASDFLAKPFSTAVLQQKLIKILSRSPINNCLLKEKTITEIEEDPKPTILIVDDMVENIKILAEVLKDDYQTLFANSASKALDICHSSTPPDLILLDIMMPDVNGIELCKKIKADPLIAHIAIIFITALNKNKHIVTGLEAGAIDYITKPLSAKILKARISTHMSLLQSNQRMRRQFNDMVKVANLRKDLEKLTELELRKPLEQAVNLLPQIKAHTSGNRQLRETTRELSEHLLNTQQSLFNMMLIYDIELDTYELKKSRLSLKELVQDISNALIDIPKSKSIELQQELTTLFVNVDFTLTKAIMLTLIKTAFFCSERGSNIYMRDFSGGSNYVLCIEFCSAGFKPPHMNKQAKNEASDNHYLSLSCAMRLADFQGGTLLIMPVRDGKNKFKFELHIPI